jgi:hypothetical protein
MSILVTKNATTYETELGDKPNDVAQAKIVIGGSDPTKFMPNINASKWGDECFLNLNFKDIAVKSEKASFSIGKVEITVGPATFFAYTVGDGVLECGLRLSGRVPALTELRLPLIYSDGLEFYFQPELTQREIDNGDIRPPNVVGSYAVYWKKSNNQYKTGKFCHLYRWECTDADGKKVWCEPLKIDSNELIIGLPATWLLTAKYPVTIMGAGDTIGYTTAGQSNANFMGVTKHGTGPGAVTLTAYHVHCQNCDSADYQVKGTLYDDNTGPANLVAYTDAYYENVGSTFDWADLTGLSIGINESGILWVGNIRQAPTITRVSYDDTTGVKNSIDYTDLTWPTIPNPFGDFGIWNKETKRSAYWDFTAAGGLSIPVAMANYRQRWN